MKNSRDYQIDYTKVIVIDYVFGIGIFYDCNGSVTKSPKRLKFFLNVTGNVPCVGTNYKNFNLTVNISELSNCSQDVLFFYCNFCLKRVFRSKLM